MSDRSLLLVAYDGGIIIAHGKEGMNPYYVASIDNVEPHYCPLRGVGRMLLVISSRPGSFTSGFRAMIINDISCTFNKLSYQCLDPTFFGLLPV
jgi:hypothetical protein